MTRKFNTFVIKYSVTMLASLQVAYMHVCYMDTSTVGLQSDKLISLYYSHLIDYIQYIGSV